MNVKTWSEWINESFNDKDIYYYILENLYKSDFLTDLDRYHISKASGNYTFSEYMIKESFFDTLRDRFDKAKEVATNISNAGKEALDKLLNKAKDLLDFVKKIKEQIITYIKDLLSKTKEKIKEKIQANPKFKSKCDELFKKEKNKFVDDLKLCKEIFEFYTKNLTTKFVDMVTKGVSGVLSSDKEPAVDISEGMITEGMNDVLSKFINGVSHIPPFSWLHNVAHIGEAGANKIIGALRLFTEKLGGPKFVLPVIGALLGIAFEYNVKGLAKQGLIQISAGLAVPFITTIIVIIGWIATFLAAVAVIDQLTGAGIFGHEDHGHSAHGKPEDGSHGAEPTPAH